MTKRYIAVGDVHGQHRLLHQAIQDLDDGNTFFILLGDLNDSRLKGPAQDYASSLESIYEAMRLMDRGIGITLQSNHGVYLHRALLGGEMLPYSTTGLSHTLQEMEQLDPSERVRIGKWLASLPYYWDVSIPIQSGYAPTHRRIWYAAHGMWVPGMDKYRPTREEIEAAVYGRGPVGKRSKFWESEEYVGALPANTYTVSGHYHKVITKPPCFIIDNNCGSGGPLMALCLNDLTEYEWSE